MRRPIAKPRHLSGKAASDAPGAARRLACALRPSWRTSRRCCSAQSPAAPRCAPRAKGRRATRSLRSPTPPRSKRCAARRFGSPCRAGSGRPRRASRRRGSPACTSQHIGAAHAAPRLTLALTRPRPRSCVPPRTRRAPRWRRRWRRSALPRWMGTLTTLCKRRWRTWRSRAARALRCSSARAPCTPRCPPRRRAPRSAPP